MKKKNVIFLGDSITEGHGASSEDKCFVSLISKMDDFGECYNAGIGGTRIARNIVPGPWHRHNSDFNLRVCILPEKADYVVVFGGTNDYGHGDVPLGNIGDNTVYSFAGAIELLIKSLSERYGKKAIRFILPTKRSECDKPSPFNKYPLVDFVNKEIEVLKYYDIPYLDLFNDGPEMPLNDDNAGFYFDGLHPNDNGYRYLADKIADFIRKTENK